ncbi:hypothetical protein [Nonomuraea indica]|uniref:hypothetical protein n=1 Tax=Nonomuraea indica TaxID=1581193 RepID=UPI0015DF53AA|nr:hypothetical protein [Nonomuraea indica]
MPRYPTEETRQHLRRRLNDHARSRRQVAGIDVSFRGEFAHIVARLHGGAYARLCRLRFTGCPDVWGLALYLPDEGLYQDSLLPDGSSAGSPEDALDRACAFQFADPDVPTPVPPAIPRPAD